MALSITEYSGRPARVVAAEIVRELDESDLEKLGGDRGVKAPTLKRLTDMHHSIARLVAQGEAGYAIAMATGYSQSRISILKSDPAFQELVEFYREKVEEARDAAFVDLNRKMAAVLSDTLDALHDRVLDEEVPVRDLVDVGKFVADRAGFGPASKSTNTNVNIDLADALAAGRQRALTLSAAVPAAKAGRGELLPPRPAGGRDE